MRDQAFPKSRRLRKRHEYLELARMGHVIHSTNFLLCVRTGTRKPGRLGVTVTRKIGNACFRNRIKRLCREFYRKSGQNLLVCSDGNIVAKKGVRYRSNHALYGELKKLFIKASEEG